MNKFFKPSLPIGMIGSIISLVLFFTNGFYVLVIPVFEKTMDNGPAFKAVDDLVFYMPCIFMVLFLAYLIAGLIYKKDHRCKTEDKATEELIAKNAGIRKELYEKAEYLSHEYYRNCPSCGSARTDGDTVCSFCGTPLIRR